MRSHPQLIIALLLILAWGGGAQAAELTNSGTISGNWVGNAEPDIMTNEATGTVTGQIIATRNSAEYSSGGGNTIYNYGTVNNRIYGSYNSGEYSSGGGNTVINYGDADVSIFASRNNGSYASGGGNTIINQSGGTVQSNLYGSYNQGNNSSGGGNYIYNYGLVSGYIEGSYNEGQQSNGAGSYIYNMSGATAGHIWGSSNSGSYSSGGGNTIYNSGSVTNEINGSYNRADNSTGGENIIYNQSGGTVTTIHGSYNEDDNSSGGGNTIYNQSGGTVTTIYGSYNEGENSSGGENTIYNQSGGTVTTIYGSYNEGDNSSGGGNTIYNYGTVTGDIYGTSNTGTGSSGGVAGNTIYNDGTVGGSIYGNENGTGDVTINNTGTVDDLIVGNYSGDGDAVIINSGTVTDMIIGAYDGTGDATITNSGTVGYLIGNEYHTGDVVITNSGTVNSAIYGNFYSTGDAEITNSGTVLGDIYGNYEGAGNTTITNSGTVSGSIYAGDGEDTVYILSGSDVGGVVDGQNGTDTLAFISAGTVENSIYLNFENLSIFGGSTTLTGSWNFDGTVNNSGSLNVNGTLSAGSLSNNGVLGGSGTIYGSLLNYGVISPGNSIGTLEVVGSVTFASGSSLLVELASNGQSDLLSVSGTVTIEGGVISTTIPRALYADGFSWTVLTAGGGINGTFGSIDDQTGSAVLSLSQSYSGNSLSLVLSRKSYSEFAGGPNAVSLSQTLDSLVSLATDDMESLLISMDFDMDADQISQTLDALNPEMYTAFSAASLQAGGLFDQAMAGRLDGLGRQRALGLPAVEEGAPRDWSVWSRVLGLWADQDAAEGYLGRGQSTAGLALGADYMLRDWLVLGMAAGVTHTDLSWSSGDYDGDIDAVHTGLYARAGLGAAFARLTASYANLANSAARPIAFQGLSAEAKGEFDADLFAAGLALGYQAHLGSWLLEPLAGLDGQWLSEQGLTESSAGFLGMRMDGRDTESLLAHLGVSASRLYRAGGWELLPRLGLAWKHQLGDEQPVLEASFFGYSDAPFSVQGADMPGDILLAEAGLDVGLRPGIDFFGHYTLTVADDYLAQALNAGVKFSF